MLRFRLLALALPFFVTTRAADASNTGRWISYVAEMVVAAAAWIHENTKRLSSQFRHSHWNTPALAISAGLAMAFFLYTQTPAVDCQIACTTPMSHSVNEFLGWSSCERRSAKKRHLLTEMSSSSDRTTSFADTYFWLSHDAESLLREPAANRVRFHRPRCAAKDASLIYVAHARACLAPSPVGVDALHPNSSTSSAVGTSSQRSELSLVRLSTHHLHL